MTKTKQAPQEWLYMVVGVGDFALEKLKSIGKIADPARTRKYYSDFVKRGKSVSKRVRAAAPTKEAVAQTKVARARVRAAATSVTKAVRADAKATKSAAAKVAKVS